MEVTVITNRMFPVKVEETDTVLTMKHAIREVAHVPPDAMVLSIDDVTMSDDVVLSEYGIKDGGNVELEILAPPADFSKYVDMEIVEKPVVNSPECFGILPGLTIKVQCLDRNCPSAKTNYCTLVYMGFGSFDLVAIRFACLLCRMCGNKAVPIATGFLRSIIFIGGQKAEVRLSERQYIPAGVFREFDAISHVNWDILNVIVTPLD